MKLSAKITTATFLAATALGAAALTGGCTVTSTTSTDTDGGTSSSGGSSGTTSSSGGSSGTPSTDSGTDSAAPTCDGLTGKTYSFATTNLPDCDSCIVEKCCTEVKACFNHQVTAPNVDCNVYSECIATCNNDDNAPATCYDDCDAATDDQIPTQYDTITTCGQTNCKTECGF